MHNKIAGLASLIFALMLASFGATALRAQATATPVITLATGTYAMPTSTTITDSTSGASILWCYIASGTCTPATAYTAAIYLDPASAETICANATASGYSASSTVCNTYTNSGFQTAQVTGSGTTGTVPVFTGTSTVGNSPITVSGSNVGIGTTAPLSPLSVSGQVVIGNPYRGDASLHITAAYGCCGRYTQMDANGPSQNILNLMGSSDSNGNAHYFAWGVNAGSWTINPGEGFGPAFTINGSGNVGIGTTSPISLLSVGASSQFQVNSSGAVTSGSIISSGPVGIGVSPQYTLDVAGQIHASQVIYASGGITFPDGSSLNSANTLCGGDYAESVDVTGKRAQYEPGDVLVLDTGNPGKFLKSTEPYSTVVAGIYSTKPGAIGRRQSTPKSPDEVPMAMVGIVPVKATAENGPIRVGDLLVSSSTPGLAMKGADRSRMLGAVIGKAMGSLDSGTGVIEILVTLQ